MNILLLSSSYPLDREDPTSYFVHDLALHLVSAGHHVGVVAPATRESAPNEVIGGVEVHRFAYVPPTIPMTLAYGPGGAENLRSPAALVQVPPFTVAFLWSAWKIAPAYELIHAHWVPPAVLALLVGGLRRLPVVASIHRMAVGAGLWRRMNEIVLTKADHVFFNSNYTLRLSEKLVDRRATVRCGDGGDRAKRFTAQRSRWDVLGPGVELADFSSDAEKRTAFGAILRRRHAVDRDTKILFSMGRLVEKKGFSFLIDALSHLSGEEGSIPRWTLLLAGWGNLRFLLEEQVRRLGVSDRVRFVGTVSPAERPLYFGGSDIFVLPSIVDPRGETETLGVVLMEAMASGLPCIATRVGGIPEVVADGVSGILVSPGDADSLGDALSRLLRSPQTCAGMGRTGTRIATERFGWVERIRAIEHVYRTCLENACKGS